MQNHTSSNERKRKIIWYNPPFSKNVSTSVGKIFLKTLDQVSGPDVECRDVECLDVDNICLDVDNICLPVETAWLVVENL